MRQRAEVGFLDHVLGFGPVPDNRVHKPEQALMITPAEGLVTLAVTIQNSTD
jgi:hypothetical protein